MEGFWYSSRSSICFKEFSVSEHAVHVTEQLGVLVSRAYIHGARDT